MAIPEWTAREIQLARLLMTVDWYLADFDGRPAPQALEHYSGCFVAMDAEPWANGKHSGDCTKECHTCARCLCEKYLTKARNQCKAFDEDLPEERDQLLAIARAANLVFRSGRDVPPDHWNVLNLLDALPDSVKAEIEK